MSHPTPHCRCARVVLSSRFVRLALLFAILGALARAHDPGLSALRVEVTALDVRLQVSLAPADALLLLPPEQRRSDWAEMKRDLGVKAATFYAPSLDESALRPPAVNVEVKGETDIEIQANYLRPAGSRLLIKSLLFTALPPGHRQYAIAVSAGGEVLAEKLLHGRDSDLQIVLPPVLAVPADAPKDPVRAVESPGAVASRPTFGLFLKIGLEHILIGYDHLLFLFALLVVCSRWGTIVGIITSFTLGHSLTLILATLDWIRMPPGLVEPAIAASIVYVGVENLFLRGREPRGRWLLTFIFGLVHGFGFAGVLRDLGVGETGGGMLMPLFSFNLGVEFGQLLVAAAVLPILHWARRRPAFVERAVPALSLVIALAGLYWLVERTILS